MTLKVKLLQFALLHLNLISSQFQLSNYKSYKEYGSVHPSILSQHMDALTHTQLLQTQHCSHRDYSTNCCPAGCSPLRTSCITFWVAALSCLLCSFSRTLQQLLTRETVDIIVCRSLLVALTSGESLCGSLTEMFEVLGGMWSCVLAHIIPQILVGGQMSCLEGRAGSAYSCRSDLGRWTERLLNGEFLFFRYFLSPNKCELRHRVF